MRSPSDRLVPPTKLLMTRVSFVARAPLLALAGAVTLLAVAAPTQTLAYDGFGYGTLANLAGSNGGVGWTGPWFDVGTDLTGVAATGLAYAGLATTPGAAVTPAVVDVYPMTSYERTFQPPTAGTTALYVSFLLRYDAAAGDFGGLTFGQYPYAMYVGAPPGFYTYGLMMSQGLGDAASKPLVVGETTLVVVKIALGTPSGVAYSLFLDPTIGLPEPAYAAATYGLPLLALPTKVTLHNGTGFTTDEIRVGTTWASVLPAGPSPWTDFGFAKPGYLGAPHLVGSGPLTGNSTNTLLLTNAYPSALVVQGLGLAAINAPYLGGILVPDPVLIFAFASDAAGTATWPLFVPAGLPAGLPLVMQQWIQDPMATYGWSASNGVRALLQ